MFARLTVRAGTVARLAMALGLSAMLVATGTSEAATRKRHFSPFDSFGNIKSSFSVKRRSSDCNSESFVNGRSDAWRCFVGNTILDPCFEAPFEEDVAVCVESPWSHRAV